MKLEGKVALITGGNQGIGLAIARRYAQEGATSLILARDRESGEKSALEITSLGGKAHFIRCDLTDFTVLPSVVAQAVSLAGHVDILVNNAGIAKMQPLLDVTPESWDAIFNTNLKGLFFMLQAAAAQMIKQGKGGKIINISSQAGRRGEKFVSAYCASKAAVISLNQSAALELVQHRINVNGIAPGVIDTPMWVDVDAQLSKHRGFATGSVRKLAESGVPYGRFGVPDDLAGAAVFLASDDAEYVVAQTLNVDGGNWMS